jgi:hypothetical protein
MKIDIKTLSNLVGDYLKIVSITKLQNYKATSLKTISQMKVNCSGVDLRDIPIDVFSTVVIFFMFFLFLVAAISS